MFNKVCLCEGRVRARNELIIYVRTSIRAGDLSVCCPGAYRRELTMPGWKDISNNLSDTGVAAHQPGMMKFIILQRKRLFPGGKHRRQLPAYPGVDVPADSAQGQSVKLTEMPKKPKSSISDSAGLSRLKVMT
ncbi:hypothetical protein ILYODFUR_033667 [Ilyodon furcidens]|uniref:Uncharacterized protein n=1 Tax=Ilyodon furcidens TaxID=33524 RepID=A0ABV0V8Z0_9TELE